MEDTSKPSRSRHVIIGALAAPHAVDVSAILLLGLLLPHMARELDLSPSQQGWLGSAHTFTLLALTIPTNALISRYRPWWVASISFLGVAGFLFLQAWAPIFALLLLGRIGMGLAYSQSDAAASLLVQQWSSPRQVPSTNGTIIAISDICLGVAFFITPPLIDGLGGWRNTLYFWAGFALLGALVWIALGRERVTSDYRKRLASQAGTPLSSIFKYRELWILGIGMFGGMAMESAFSVFWPTFAEQELEVPSSVVGSAIGLYFFAAAPAELLVMVVPLFIRWRLLVLVITAFLTLGSHLALLFTGSTTLILLVSVARGASICYWPIVITMVYQLPRISPREVAVGLAFIYTCVNAGGATGPLLVGFMQEATGDLRLALLVTVFFPLTLILTALLMHTRLPRQGRGAPAAQPVP